MAKNTKTKNILRSQKKFNIRLVAPLAIMLVAVGSFVVWQTFAARPISVPSEFIARIYSDALGRIPDQNGWNFWQERFEREGCTTEQLKRFVVTVYNSSEYSNIPYDNSEKLLSLYRGALSREPEKESFDKRVAQLNNGTAFKSFVDEFASTPEFNKLATGICSSADTNYSFKGTPIVIKGTMSQQTLQAKLDAATPGTTVTLPRGSTIPIEARLTIPNGVTLTTEGNVGLKGRQAYASMARLYYRPTAAKIDKASLVVVKDGATLRNVWIDGQMWNYPNKDGGQNVRIAPNSNARTVVEFVRSDNPRAAQNVVVNSNDGECNVDALLQSNLVVNNANIQVNSRWADGIASACANSKITNNEVVDASDVAIILYKTFGQYTQKSQVTGNKVLQAGNTAFGGLVIDPLSTKTMERPYPTCLNKVAGSTPNCDFSGATFKDNILWTGKDARFIIGISVGTRAWGFFKPDSATGKGGTFTGNSTGLSEANVQIPVYVSGVRDSVVKDNFKNSKVKIVKGKIGTTGQSCATDTVLTVNKDYISSGIDSNYKVLNNDKCI